MKRKKVEKKNSKIEVKEKIIEQEIHKVLPCTEEQRSTRDEIASNKDRKSDGQDIDGNRSNGLNNGSHSSSSSSSSTMPKATSQKGAGNKELRCRLSVLSLEIFSCTKSKKVGVRRALFMSLFPTIPHSLILIFT